jgi:GH15 family glucan-1,4-alpha-glucosidase
MAAFDFVERGGELRRTAKKFVAGFAKVVREKWREPDNSIWEVRGDRRDYTYSKLMCWAALDRLVALHERGAIEIDADRCRAEQDRIREAIETHAYNDALGSYVGVFGTDLLDASLLMMPRAGYVEPTNPRMTSTYETLRSRLGDGGFMRRYSDGFDAAGRAEGSFGICGFWEIDYLARAGRVDEAERRFGQWLNHANDLGLYAEEIDPGTGNALGNFPQAFTHVGLINAALAIYAAKSRPGGRQ